VIEFIKKTPKAYDLGYNEEVVVSLDLISSSITNKYYIITNFIEDLSEKIGPEFDEWFTGLLTTYDSNNEQRYLIMTDAIPSIKDYVNRYIDVLDIDWSQFVDESKAKKNTILFNPGEIETISRLSGYLKLYSVIFNTANFKLDQRLHKKIYNSLAEDIDDTEIINKIFNIVRTKTFKYNFTDKYMWDYIKMIQCKSIDVHVIEIFNFIMNSILIMCEVDKNPITYFVSVVEESVKWFLRSVYKSSVIYEDSIATENIHSLSVNNLKTYSYNDTLGRLKGISYEKLYRSIERTSLLPISDEDSDSKSDKMIVSLQNRLNNIEFVSPLCEFLVFPILASITKIPYNHFKTLSPEHSAVLSIYVQKIMKKVFKSDYKNLISLLEYYPINPPAIATTYKIKLVHDYNKIQNDTKNFFGFNTKILPYKILSYFIGRTSRVNFCNIFDGKRLAGIPLSKIESDVIKFYTMLYSNQFENEITEMRRIINIDF